MKAFSLIILSTLLSLFVSECWGIILFLSIIKRICYQEVIWYAQSSTTIWCLNIQGQIMIYMLVEASNIVFVDYEKDLLPRSDLICTIVSSNDESKRGRGWWGEKITRKMVKHFIRITHIQFVLLIWEYNTIWCVIAKISYF